MSYYRSDEKKRLFRLTVDKLIKSDKVDSGMESVIFAAKEREACETGYRLSLQDDPGLAIGLDGSMGETLDDIEFILSSADSESKMLMLNRAASDNFSSNLDKSTIKSLIRDCSDIFGSVSNWSGMAEKNALKFTQPFIRCNTDSYIGSVKLIDFLERSFKSDDELEYFSHKFLETHHFGADGKLHLYDYLIKDIIGNNGEPNPEIIESNWIRKEAAISRGGKDLFLEGVFTENSFIMVFESLIKSQKCLMDSGGINTGVEKVLRCRIRSYAKVLIKQLDKGLNESLSFFGDRNLNLWTNPLGKNILRFSKEVSRHTFSDGFKAEVIGKIVVAICNGHAKNMHKPEYNKLLELSGSIVNWEAVVDGLSRRGKQFLIENSKAPWLFEPYLDRNSRTMLLRGDLSL